MYDLSEDDRRVLQVIESGAKLTTAPCSSKLYCSMLKRLLLRIADSQMSIAAELACYINEGPSLCHRIEMAQAVTDELNSAKRIYDLLEQFGIDEDKYFDEHEWEWSLESHQKTVVRTTPGDPRLLALLMPIDSVDEVPAFLYLVSKLMCVLLEDAISSSFRPWAGLAGELLAVEERHCRVGMEMLRLAALDTERLPAVEGAIKTWGDRVSRSLEYENSRGNLLQQSFALTAMTATEERLRWQKEAAAELARNMLSFGGETVAPTPLELPAKSA
jgi:1,2-phenylacetyl-CoA epoxidase catalytic subunit